MANPAMTYDEISITRFMKDRGIIQNEYYKDPKGMGRKQFFLKTPEAIKIASEFVGIEISAEHPSILLSDEDNIPEFHIHFLLCVSDKKVIGWFQLPFDSHWNSDFPRGGNYYRLFNDKNDTRIQKLLDRKLGTKLYGDI